MKSPYSSLNSTILQNHIMAYNTVMYLVVLFLCQTSVSYALALPLGLRSLAGISLAPASFESLASPTDSSMPTSTTSQAPPIPIKARVGIIFVCSVGIGLILFMVIARGVMKWRENRGIKSSSGSGRDCGECNFLCLGC
jgi:hypothetical protein